MDDVRDMQVSNLSRFLDVSVRTDPFGENRSGERVYRRGERLVAALFLLTKHISTEEHLRNEVRHSATSMLKQILTLRNNLRTLGSQNINEFQATIRLLISLVKMLMFSGFISSQNAESAADALDELGNFVMVSQRSALSENIRLSREDLLDVQEPRKGHLKDIKDRESVKDKLLVKDSEAMSVMGDTSSQSTHSTRAKSIITILRTGSDFNIRDISANLPEYSEKTIQREIAALVEIGLVRRSGLKRWSRYSIV